MAPTHTAMIESVLQDFARTFGDAAGVTVVMAPGRVNLIGEYTDFNDGYVFPMTIDRGVYLAVRARTDRRVRVASIRYDELVECELGEFSAPRPGSWRSYVLGVVEEFRLRGLLGNGFEMVLDGNLDPGAGLSSSAALEVSTAMSLQQIAGFDMEPVEMVRLCQQVEHDYARVLCGIMDQFACRIGRRGHALFLDCRSLDYDHVPLALGDHRVVIVSSGVGRSLADSAYNARRAECRAAVEQFGRYEPEVSALRDVDPELFDAHGDELPNLVRRRARHVIGENRRVLDAVASLRAGRLDDFGRLMTESHRSLRIDFEVSCPELDMLVELANGTAGVLGSRMTGAGFGGSTVSIVHVDAVGELTARLNAEYPARFDLTPGVFVVEGNREAGPVSVPA